MNSNSSKTASIICAGIVIAAFFMPWITLFINVNAWDLIFGNIGQAIDSPVRFLGAIIPISSILIIYAASFNKEKYPIQKSLLFSLPIITLIVFAIIIIGKLASNGASNLNGDIIKVFGMGFWLTLIGSIALAIIGSYKPVATATNIPSGTIENDSSQHPEVTPVAVELPVQQVPVQVQQTQVTELKAEPAKDFFKQPANLLLIASALIFIGFFMPWVDVPSMLGPYVPTINGTYLISQANQIRDFHLIVVCFLLLSPVCSAIIAYNSYQKDLAEKKITVSVSLATFLPVLALVVYFFSFTNIARDLTNIIGEGASMGKGMVMMIAGSLYYLFYIVKNIANNNKLLSSKSLIMQGIVGGVIIGGLYYLLILAGVFEQYRSGRAFLNFLPLLLSVFSIIITNNLHKKSLGGITNYSRVITLGVIVTISFFLAFYILGLLHNSWWLNRKIIFKAPFFVLIVSAAQLGFAVSAIVGIWLDKPSTLPKLSMVVEGHENPMQSGSAVPSSPGFLNIVKRNCGYFIVGLVLIVGMVMWMLIRHDMAKVGSQSSGDTVVAVAAPVNNEATSNTVSANGTPNPTTWGIYPQASNRLLTSNDLIGLDKMHLRIMRNEIFARHGYIFRTAEMKKFFSGFTWYKPIYADVTNQLTNIEKANVELIKTSEK